MQFPHPSERTTRVSTDTTLDQPTADAVKARRGRPPKATTPAAANGAAPKRSGRPAAPQTRTEAVDAFRAKVQAARKAIWDARLILNKLIDLDGPSEEVDWISRVEILNRLDGMDYVLYAAQATIRPTTYSRPTDKI